MAGIPNRFGMPARRGKEGYRMREGIQISSLKPYLQTEQDASATIARVARMGYRYVQLQWFSFDVPVESIARALKENGMVSVGTQEKYDECAKRFDYFVSLNRACGSNEICMSGIPARFADAEGIKQHIADMREYGKRAAGEGMTVSYHLVEADFRRIDGKPACDILLDSLPEIRIVADTNQLLRAKADPAKWIAAHAGRVVTVHFKDMEAPVAGAKLKPVGQGMTDFPPIVRACREAGVQYVLAEQESWEKDAFLCMEESLAYIRGIL